MAIVKGFQGLRYNKEKVKNFSKVMAPPYDVISKKGQGTLRNLSPYNVIRLILGKNDGVLPPEADPPSAGSYNKYKQAGAFLKKWRRSQVLMRDTQDSIYVYAQDYKEASKKKTRLGFIAVMKIDEGSVLKHENTLLGPKQDRFALIKEVKTNLSPIFGLFEDRPGGVNKLLKKALDNPPAIDVTLDQVRHRIYRESRPQVLKPLFDAMRKKPIFIADGHHRFEVACQFKEYMDKKLQKAKNKPWHYVMSYFADGINNPFSIYPTHRLLALKQNPGEALETLKKIGHLKPVKNLSTLLHHLKDNRRETSDKNYTFGVYMKAKGFFIFTLNRSSLKKKSSESQVVQSLDVSVLHRSVLSPCFGIRAIEKSKEIDFERDTKVVCQKVDSGAFDMAIFLRPTSLDEMFEVSKKGLKMPQKSTYFYPKLLSGLVFHSLEDFS